MKCPLCKGSMKQGMTHVNHTIGTDGLIVLMHVPALICDQCGDEFIELPVARQIEKKIDRVLRDNIKMGFVEFAEAA
jgi:YgiT-type zinc finger domain-containing protein